MDYKKDISLSNNGKEIRNRLILSLFEKDKYILFIFKKSERIVSALYLVSNLFSETEPLKWQFRNIGLGIVSQVLSLSSSQKNKVDTLHQLAVDFVKLLSLLDVAYVARVVSEMNFKLLKRELELLLETLSDNGFSSEILPEKNVSLSDNYFSIPTDQITTRTSDVYSRPTQVSYPSVTSETPDQLIRQWSDMSRNQLKTNKGQSGTGKINKDNSGSAPLSTSAKTSGGEVSRSQRELLIVELLKTKNNLTVKDFTEVIKGFSDKTIQRELLRLVGVGVLKKVGERRWSRYSLSN